MKNSDHSLSPLPVLFIGHGSPMNALGGPHAAYWATMGAKLPRPKAILVISAHWYVPDLAITAMELPRTIHDFQGFPAALQAVQYPAPGSPWLADQVSDLLAPQTVRHDLTWGLDHGAWSVLVHLFPKADIPVAQLSLDRRQPLAFHFELGRKLRALRRAGVLIIGSGAIVHNLRLARFGPDAVPLEWAERFNNLARERVMGRHFDSLIEYPALGGDALLAVPTPEHYLPLLYCLGAATDDDALALFTDVIDLAAISMTGVAIGAAAA